MSVRIRSPTQLGKCVESRSVIFYSITPNKTEPSLSISLLASLVTYRLSVGWISVSDMMKQSRITSGFSGEATMYVEEWTMQVNSECDCNRKRG